MISGAPLATPGELWCSAYQTRWHPSWSASTASSTEVRTASPAEDPATIGVRSSSDSGRDTRDPFLAGARLSRRRRHHGIGSPTWKAHEACRTLPAKCPSEGDESKRDIKQEED